MKLSIIVPVYNAEKYLRVCLDSLTAQTVDDYEILLINDGSSDSSPEIMEDYRRRYPDLIRTLTVENGGQGRARNIAMDLARGEYLGFVDSDDWVDPAMFEKLLAAAEESGADMAQCDAVECWADGHTRYADMTGCRDEILIPTAVWNKLIRRSAAEGVRFAERLWYEDIAFVIKLLLRVDKIANVREGLYFYRCGQSSTMNNHNARKNLDIIRIMEELREPLAAAGRTADFETLLINHLLLDTINRVAVQDSPDKGQVCAELRAYAKKYIPRLLRCPSFQKESRNRRIVLFLNYHGLEGLSRLLLQAKKTAAQ